MDFKKFPEELKKAISILTLKVDKMKEVAANKESLIWGLIFVLAPALVNIILMRISLSGSGLGSFVSGLLFWPFLIPVLAIGGMTVTTVLVAEKAYKAKIDYNSFVRVSLYAYIVGAISLVATLFLVLGITGLYYILVDLSVLGFLAVLLVQFKMLMDMFSVKKNDAIVAVVSGGAAYFLLSFILGKLFLGMFYQFLYF